jgi:hypothetical protein
MDIKVKIYINDTWVDISNYIDTKTGIQTQKRIDDAFGTGTLKALLNISYNIAPYTPMIINIDTKTEYYVCSSTCTRYLNLPNSYIHDFDIIQAESLLSCFILGSKNFSITGTNKKDAEKIIIICKLMEQKYGVKFVFNANGVVNDSNEFTFGPGTTMHDAINEILTLYNAKISIIYTISAGVMTINITPVALKFDTEYFVNDNRIINVMYTQQSETYGNILESEMNNVIDRTNTTRYEYISSRSDSVQISADTAKLILPSNVEEITKLEINSAPARSFKITNIPYSIIKEAVPVIGNFPSKTFEEWNQLLYITFTDHEDGYQWNYYPLDYFYSNLPLELKFDKSLSFQMSAFYDDGAAQYYILTAGDTIEQKLDITGRLLEKSQYDLLEAKEQVKYCYYQKGGNTIEGFNETYKDDFWNTLLGETERGVMYHIASEINTSKTIEDEYTPIVINASLVFTDLSRELTTYSFNVECRPICDMFVSSTKTVETINESTFKPYARTYDKSCNFIDFDRMIYSLQKTNDSEGLPELTLEYNIKGIELPEVGQCIYYDSKLWHIFNATRMIDEDGFETITLNLVSSYSKIAEAIGIKSQFNTTKNPLDNVIDRYIYDEVRTSNIVVSNMYLKFNFTFSDSTTTNLYKRAAVYSNNGVDYVVCAMQDNYSFDSEAIKVEGTYYENRQCPYVDDHNEFMSVVITGGTIDMLTLEESYELPKLTSTSKFKFIFKTGNILVYKDARERLIFTIKLTH